METGFLKNSKILIVDDNLANIEVLTTLLSMEGYENVEKTTDSRDVLDLYLRYDPDLILLDLNMPYMSGFEVMEQLQQIINNQIYLPILVLTADASDATKKKALAAGASDFLSKPFDLVEVSLRIQNLLYTNYLYSQVKDQNLILEEKVRDRTKELEFKNEQLKKAWELADAANRLKLAFLNNISHEIRTPLNGIIGFSHLLSDSSIGFNEKAEYLKIMQESSNRLINTVTSFLDISLLNSGNMEVMLSPFQPSLVIFEIYQKFIDACSKKKIELEISKDAAVDGLIVNSDKNLLRKILENLVDNAVKFTPQGKIELGCSVVNKQIRFFVKDTGVGVSPEFQSRIFKSFNQENEYNTRSFEGIGLGLSISKGLVDLLGGHIDYISEPGAGSEFFFTLPLKTEEVLPVAEEKEKEENDKKNKILIVEDDDTNFYLLYFFLSGKNVEIIHARGGQEAIDFFNENDDIELILMDLKLPDIDGFRVTEKIKANKNKIPLIVISAFSGNQERQRAFSSGCDDFIVKPVSKPELFDVMSKYITISTL